jgi:hypothetical protein
MTNVRSSLNPSSRGTTFARFGLAVGGLLSTLLSFGACEQPDVYYDRQCATACGGGYCVTPVGSQPVVYNDVSGTVEDNPAYQGDTCCSPADITITGDSAKDIEACGKVKGFEPSSIVRVQFISKAPGMPGMCGSAGQPACPTMEPTGVCDTISKLSTTSKSICLPAPGAAVKVVTGSPTRYTTPDGKGVWASVDTFAITTNTDPAQQGNYQNIPITWVDAMGKTLNGGTTMTTVSAGTWVVSPAGATKVSSSDGRAAVGNFFALVGENKDGAVINGTSCVATPGICDRLVQ